MHAPRTTPKGAHEETADVFSRRPACTLVGWNRRNRSNSLRFFYVGVIAAQTEQWNIAVKRRGGPAH